MEIHKPKPWQGSREFLKEYLIIVVGVLTALAAEQGVEWLHWSHKVEQARKQEIQELRGIRSNAIERNSVYDCLDHRLSALQEALLNGEGRWTPLKPAMNAPFLGDTAYYAPTRPWADETWKSLVADGTVNHFKDDEGLRYARVYSLVAMTRARNENEWAAVAALGILQQDTVLSRPERNALAGEAGSLRTMNRLMTIGARQLMMKITEITPVDAAASRANYQATSNSYRSCMQLGYPSPPLVDAPKEAMPGMPATPATTVARSDKVP